MTRTALIVGATGGVGSETAKALLEHGWTVRALTRDVARAARQFAWIGAIDWRPGDALNAADVLEAARGVDVVVHAANPPGYRNWKGLVLPMLESSITAARQAGARLVLPGTIYNYGPDAFPTLRETSPQHAHTRKGRIRVAMEARLEQATKQGLRVLIVRAGDFFGPRAGNSWFSQGLVKPGRPLTAVRYPGKPDVGHAWAYLPDLARTLVRLLDREKDLEAFARYHFGGHWFERGVEMAEAARRAARVPNAPIRRFPWWLVTCLSPFIETFREMREMRYLWTTPVRLDNSRLVAFLGEEPHTPLDQALRATLAGLGCMDHSNTRAPRFATSDG